MAAALDSGQGRAVVVFTQEPSPNPHPCKRGPSRRRVVRDRDAWRSSLHVAPHCPPQHVRATIPAHVSWPHAGGGCDPAEALPRLEVGGALFARPPVRCPTPRDSMQRKDAQCPPVSDPCQSGISMPDMGGHCAERNRNQLRAAAAVNSCTYSFQDSPATSLRVFRNVRGSQPNSFASSTCVMLRICR
jgi:hypothetical protein